MIDKNYNHIITILLYKDNSFFNNYFDQQLQIVLIYFKLSFVFRKYKKKKSFFEFVTSAKNWVDKQLLKYFLCLPKLYLKYVISFSHLKAT